MCRIMKNKLAKYVTPGDILWTGDLVTETRMTAHSVFVKIEGQDEEIRWDHLAIIGVEDE